MIYGAVPGVSKPISRLVLGTVCLQPDRKQAGFDLLDAFTEMGGNTFDTAHVYGMGAAQSVLGEWMKLRDNRGEFVLFDKGCHPYGSPRLTPELIRSDLTDNHENLQTGHTEFFVLHRDDPSQALLPILETLNRLTDEGRIATFGVSNWTLDRIKEAEVVAAENDLRGFSVNSPNLSLAHVNEPMWEGCLTADLSMRTWHEHHGLAMFAWSSAGGGYFAEVDHPEVKRVYENEINQQRIARLKSMAHDRGTNPVALATAWTLSQDYPVFALIGPETPAQLEGYWAALDTVLTSEERDWLENGEPSS